MYKLNRVQELPAVDMFVTTADPVLEPPIITVNTVLSLMALDYPANKLACYVSDDGCSPLNFYALVEASKLAKLWVPFCKKYNVKVRAPFKYFSDESVMSSGAHNSWQFHQDWKNMKEEYERLRRNIEDAAKKSAGFGFDLTGEFATRVSGIMTNAPFMLNVDCDMFANNPQIVRHAMCLLLGSKEKDCAFVQCPQLFYNNPNIGLVVSHEVSNVSFSSIGCFHRRKVIYGLWPEDTKNDSGRYYNSVMNGKVDDDEILLKEFGNSMELIKSAAHALKGKIGFSMSPSNSLDAAHQVAGSAYEYGSSWGEKVGWIYGSTAEDILTGLMIHKRGWRSGYCNPNPPAFLGCAPSNSIVAMTQQKRWTTGLLEILFSKNNPISATLAANLQFRQCLAYLFFQFWGLRSIPELCYVALPAYCIITDSNFLSKFHEPGIYIPAAIFVVYNFYTLSEYIRMGFSISSWWNNQSMTRIITMTSWIFGVLNTVLKLLGLSETSFEITKKDLDDHQSSTSIDDYKVDENAGKFIFDESAFFVLGTTVLLVQLAALATSLLGLQSPGGQGSGLAEVLCSVLVVLWFRPFMEGLFRKGKYGIPWSTIYKSAALALLFGTGASSGGHVRDDCGSGAGTANHHYESVLSGEAHNSWQFHQDWKMMKEEDERLRRNIEEAAKKSAAFDLAGEFAVFSNTEPRNHPAVIKEKDCAFAQFPQLYYNYPNNGHVIIHENIVKGIVEIEGPFYEGSGSFHKRKVIYGLRPEDTENDRRVDNDEMLLKEFGNSKELIKSAAHALKGDTNFPKDLSNSLDVAHRVAGSTYELVVYGSAVEDNLIGLMIHTRGWKSAYCNTDPPAFLGCAPSSSIEAMIQQKRWCTGLTEILFSKNNPISCTLAANLQFRQCLAYLFFQFWGLCSIPELCYAALPAYCIITDSNFLPKFQEPGIYIYVAVFVVYNLYTLSEYIRMGFSISSWHNGSAGAAGRLEHGIARVAITRGLSYIPDLCYAALPAYCIITKSIFLRECHTQALRVTRHSTTMVLMQLTGLATCSLGLQPQADQCDHHHHGAGGSGVGVGELMCSVNVVSCFWPFVMGLFGPPNA
ncbi:hypothetical protein JRO89_XS01G0135400 [Xanthoceras sorbifolium]|uniref:Cellulose synthase n=1 Tax=Xanthoceras sorbifolium TaxID=99658 RepID=A0ABQ8IKL5_9ROSI|nr:hypothetical protein JRO89_XS01G0135400 [Xanthoceras sorbifolium]